MDRAAEGLLKRHDYAQAGARHYVIVDPRVPSVMALRLDEGEYHEVGSAAGEDTIELDDPWPLVLWPADLIAG